MNGHGHRTGQTWEPMGAVPSPGRQDRFHIEDICASAQPGASCLQRSATTVGVCDSWPRAEDQT